MVMSVNVNSVVKVIGRLVLIESLLLIVPMGVCLLYGENEWIGFGIASTASMLTGGIMEFLTAKQPLKVRSREGFIITSLIWIVFALFGVIPFMLSENSLGFTDSFFEVISGLTTTGASMITDLDVQSHGILFWRALTQWIGGLGIILFMIAVLPELNKTSGISMFQAETTGITHDKLHPRIRQTALSIWGVYTVLTLVSIFLMWIGPMNLFDSICQSFAAVATGGFSTHNEGISFWHSDYILVVTIFVMLLAGLNFIMIYNAFKSGIRSVFRNSVFRTFCIIVFLSFILLSFSLLIQENTIDIDLSLIYPMFHVVSAITSTGFSICDAENWGQFSLFLTILLMLCGACAGSTSGGLKIDRLMVLSNNLINEIKKTVFPKRTYAIHLNGSALDENLISRITAFVTIYFISVIIATGLITCCGYSVTDSMFMVCSCIGCNGLGYGVTGSGGSFALLPDFVKWLLTCVMLIGRLELFTFIVLFLPSFWRR